MPNETNKHDTTAFDNYIRRRGLTYDLTDSGNADRLADMNRGEILYCPDINSWMEWDGSRWALSHTKAIADRAKVAAKAVLRDAENTDDPQTLREITTWALSSRHRSRIYNAIDLAKSCSDMAIGFGLFDNEPFRLNTPSGLIDLQSRVVAKTKATDLISQVAGAKFSKNADCPTWRRFIDEITCGDEEYAGWLQKAIGYSFTGSAREQCFFLAYGTGSNGKSTLLETLQMIAGDYASTVDMDLFTQREKNVRSLEAIGKLRGKRFVTASETADSRRFNEALLKNITGEDTITGAMLHKGSFEFRPQFTLWLACNHMPSARDGSHGFWRRVRVVPFKARFEGEQMDKDLQRKLRTEAPGILRWIIEGACEWMTDGLGSCAVVEEASNEYRQEQDTIARFLAERTEEVNHATIAARELFGEYIVWCEGEDVPAPTQKHFASKMAERGYDKKKTKRGMEYQNLRLLEEPPAISNPCDF